jgi:hypothetical protein
MEILEQKPLAIPTSPVEPDVGQRPLNAAPPAVPAAAVAPPYPRVGMVSNPDF